LARAIDGILLHVLGHVRIFDDGLQDMGLWQAENAVIGRWPPGNFEAVVQCACVTLQLTFLSAMLKICTKRI
jgi:hypothetical protein